MAQLFILDLLVFFCLFTKLTSIDIITNVELNESLI